MTEISPRQILENLFRRWYLIALGVLLGGALGWLGSRFLPPIYETHAEILLKLDSTLWHQENPDLPSAYSDYALADAVSPVSDLFYSGETIDALLALAQNDSISLDRNQVPGMFYIQRVNMTWQMTVRSSSPQTAARLADLWVQAGLSVHQTAHAHALSAFALMQQRDALSACFMGASLTSGNACAGTSFTSLNDIEPTLADLDARIASEQSSSQGLDPAMNVEAGNKAAIPQAPVQHRRTWLLFAGALIGMIIGNVLAEGVFSLRNKHGSG